MTSDMICRCRPKIDLRIASYISIKLMQGEVDWSKRPPTYLLFLEQYLLAGPPVLGKERCP